MWWIGLTNFFLIFIFNILFNSLILLSFQPSFLIVLLINLSQAIIWFGIFSNYTCCILKVRMYLAFSFIYLYLVFIVRLFITYFFNLSFYIRIIILIMILFTKCTATFAFAFCLIIGRLGYHILIIDCYICILFSHITIIILTLIFKL